jgi:hypothetical protein
MEGAAMTFVSVNPHGLLFCSPANDASWFSLSRSCAQMLRNRLDLFLDFKEKFPHSNFQTDKHDD